MDPEVGARYWANDDAQRGRATNNRIRQSDRLAPVADRCWTTTTAPCTPTEGRRRINHAQVRSYTSYCIYLLANSIFNRQRIRTHGHTRSYQCTTCVPAASPRRYILTPNSPPNPSAIPFDVYTPLIHIRASNSARGRRISGILKDFTFSSTTIHSFSLCTLNYDR